MAEAETKETEVPLMIPAPPEAEQSPPTPPSGPSERAEQAEWQEGETIEALHQALEEQSRLAEENHERFLRARAELENTRRLMREEMERVRRFGNQQLLTELLSITDNLERALDAADGSGASAVRQGIAMIYRQMRALLEREGLQTIAAEPGQIFDPSFHEAVERMLTDEYPEGSIVEVIQPGYLLHGRVLRPSRVRVAVTPATAAPSPPGELQREADPSV